MSRVAEYNILIGTNNVGKSYQLKRFLSLNKRNLILKPNPFDTTWQDYPQIDVFDILEKKTDGSFDDYERLFNNNSEKNVKLQNAVLDEVTRQYKAIKTTTAIFIPHVSVYHRILHIVKGFTDGGLFHDDFKNYIKANNISAPVRSIFGDRRHKMLDLFFACHGPDMIPPAFFNYTPVTYIFKTTGNWMRLREGFEDKRNFEALLEVKNRVNVIADTPNKVKQYRPGIDNSHYYEKAIFKF